jgi:hypothetical protein
LAKKIARQDSIQSYPYFLLFRFRGAKIRAKGLEKYAICPEKE